MTLTINGVDRAVPDDVTLYAILHREGESDRGKAAAVGGVVVPRSQWATRVLRHGEAVELITAMQGG
ncbi:sulfur carrier protein [Nakamurella panacisegetis]|uniref:Sulfur carrier protein n=1 Tax=Nakamurella panacisegetis TaxID=1090615 RepID=A0A1H0NDZ8_9ACTN|nr:sulfur carrier protein ThiS [Nakamurella panacisegetis]SDO90989.1 sulfur carrier protein [Nakamurella panacisegetis]